MVMGVANESDSAVYYFCACSKFKLSHAEARDTAPLSTPRRCCEKSCLAWPYTRLYAHSQPEKAHICVEILLLTGHKCSYIVTEGYGCWLGNGRCRLMLRHSQTCQSIVC